MKKVAVFLADGFEDIEALATVDILRRAGITCDTVSINEEYVKSAHNVIIKADKIIDKNIYDYDMVVCPGGLPGAKYLAENEMVLEVIRKFNKDDSKYIAAICASPAMVLKSAGIEENRYVTSYPGDKFENMLEKSNYVDELVVIDGNLITSRGPATTFLFAYKLVDLLGGYSKSLKKEMLWDMVEEEK